MIAKICTQCKMKLSIDNFDKNNTKKHNTQPYCKSCRRENRKLNYGKNPIITLFQNKRSACRTKNIPFDLDREYMEKIWTGLCPIFKTPIFLGSKGCGSHKSAHLDRLIPELGYVKGNVNYISGRANRIKLDATIEELRAIADWMEVQIKSATTISKESTLETIANGSGEPVLTQ